MKHKKFNEILPYTYFIIDLWTSIKYHGVRWHNVTLELTPEQDFAIKYFSSGVLGKLFKENPERFSWRFGWTFDTKEEARDYEVKVNTKIYLKEDWANRNAFPAILRDYSLPSPLKGKSWEEQGRAPMSQERIEYMREINTGRKQSKETIDKKAKTILERYGRKGTWPVGKKHSKETTEKMKDLKNYKAIKVNYNGVIYRSLEEAKRQTGISCYMLKKYFSEEGIKNSKPKVSVMSNNNFLKFGLPWNTGITYSIDKNSEVINIRKLVC